MTHILEFKHHQVIIRAVAIFNLDYYQQSVMVLPYTNKKELGDAIIITRENNKWTSDSSIMFHFKSTYKNLLTELDSVLKQRQALADVLLQQYLS